MPSTLTSKSNDSGLDKMEISISGAQLTLISMGPEPNRVRVTLSESELDRNRAMFPSTGVEV